LDFIIFLVVFRLLKFQCHLGLQVTNGHHSQTTYGRQSKDLAYPIQVKRQVGLIRWVSLPSATPSARTDFRNPSSRLLSDKCTSLTCRPMDMAYKNVSTDIRALIITPTST